MITEYVRFAFLNFRERRMRSWLTMIGIFMGIAAVVALISLGQGLQEAIKDQFEQVGTDKIIVMPGGSFYGIGGGEVDLTEKDVEIVGKAYGIEAVTGMLYKMGRVEYKDKVTYTWLMAISLEKESRELIESMQSVYVEKGRDLENGDKYKALIGYLLSDGSVLKKEVKAGDRISIEGTDFEVVGIMGVIGNPQDDSSIMLPIDTAREIFNEPEKVDMIFAQVKQGEEPSRVAETVEKDLRKFRGLKKGEEDFEVQTLQEMAETYLIILNIVNVVLIGVAAISLVVGAIGIMNTMYTSVLERTREIGIMKAIGARNSDIAQIFLIESGLLGLAGGLIGTIIGISISKGVEVIAAAYLKTTLLKAHFPLQLILGALAFSFIIGALSGLLPALQASRQNPVDALRYE